MVGVFVAFIRVVYGRTIYMSLPGWVGLLTFCRVLGVSFAEPVFFFNTFSV